MVFAGDGGAGSAANWAGWIDDADGSICWIKVLNLI